MKKCLSEMYQFELADPVLPHLFNFEWFVPILTRVLLIKKKQVLHSTHAYSYTYMYYTYSCISTDMAS